MLRTAADAAVDRVQYRIIGIFYSLRRCLNSEAD